MAAAVAVGLASGVGTGLAVVAADRSDGSVVPSHAGATVARAVAPGTSSETRRCGERQHKPNVRRWTLRVRFDRENRRVRTSDAVDAEGDDASWAEVDPRLRPEAFEAAVEPLLEAHGFGDGYVDCQAFPCFVTVPGGTESEPVRKLRKGLLEAFGPGLREELVYHGTNVGPFSSIVLLPADVPFSSVRRGVHERAMGVWLFLASERRSTGEAKEEP